MSLLLLLNASVIVRLNLNLCAWAPAVVNSHRAQCGFEPGRAQSESVRHAICITPSNFFAQGLHSGQVLLHGEQKIALKLRRAR